MTAFCRLLTSQDEVRAAQSEAQRAGLCAVPETSKHWDNMIAVEAIREAGVAPDDPIADLGCRSGIMLTWLHQLGYRQLYGCDLRSPFPPLKAAFGRRQWRTVAAGLRTYVAHRNRFQRSAVEQTTFPAATFAAITCMSVIEHGVDIDAFFEEVARLLRPGGLLVLSTDYWPAGLDLSELKRFDDARGNDRVFDREQALGLCRTGERHGLTLVGDPQLDADEPVIESEGFRYTFITLAFRRE